MLQKLMERVGLGDVFFEKAAVALVADFGEQRGDGRFDVPCKPEINRCSPSDMFRVPVDLDFLDISRNVWRLTAIALSLENDARGREPQIPGTVKLLLPPRQSRGISHRISVR